MARLLEESMIQEPDNDEWHTYKHGVSFCAYSMSIGKGAGFFTCIEMATLIPGSAYIFSAQQISDTATLRALSIGYPHLDT